MTRFKLYVLGREFFETSLITYMVLAVAEALRPGTVDNFFNPHILLGVVLASGLTMALAEKKEYRYRVVRSARE